MTHRTNGIKLPQDNNKQPRVEPSIGDIYVAYDILQRLEDTEPWAFGDRARRKDAKHSARAVLELAGAERVDQVVNDTHEWLAEKEADLVRMTQNTRCNIPTPVNQDGPQTI